MRWTQGPSHISRQSKLYCNKKKVVIKQLKITIAGTAYKHNKKGNVIKEGLQS